MAQVLGLDPEASVTSGSGASCPRTTIPPVLTSSVSASTVPKTNRHSYLQRPGSQTQAQARTRPRAKSASNLLDGPEKDKDLRFHDDTFIDQQQEGDGEPHDGLAELIDFLRNYSPPSGNFMSIPDGIPPEDRGRWHRLRKLGKRSKSLSKSPQTIRLPDSAVSGTTIGGHRHIAISIPLDASPFGRTPRSQYPIYQHRSVKPLTSQYAPTRAVLNDKGVVTVLRTVAEDRESSPSVSPANSQLLLSTIPQRSPNSSINGHSTPAPINSSNQSTAPEHLNILATPPPRVVTPDQVRQANELGRRFQSNEQGDTNAGSPNNHDRIPSRNPSLAGGRFVHLGDLSIDTMMSQSTKTEAHQVPTSPARPVSQDGSYQPSLSKSIMTTSENDPVVAEARPVEARPVSARESRIRLTTKKTEEPPVTVITKSPLRVQRQGSRKQTTKEMSSTPEARLSQSRRDKVRDKKKKDMEAASLKRRSMISISMDLQPDSEQETIREAPQEKVEEPPPLPLRSPQRQSMCPIMVVANVKPSPPPTAVGPASPKRQTTTNPEDLTFAVKLKRNEAPKQEDDTSSRAISPSPPSYQNGSPTPPQSAHSSPTHKLDSQDRTSLSRRREWSAAREQERKRKEAASNASPRPRVRRAVTMREDTGDKAPTAEKEVLRRYEAYREYRIREMERRIRRLERNGDVWLRALVPVLDNLNRTLANSQDGHPSGAKGWISDDDRSNFQATSKMRPSSRGRMMARTGTSEREFLEQLVRTKEELEAGSVSDDMSGFDTIEPLMRELAGRSRLSFEARSLGMGDEGLLHSLSE
ncbi:uncharacterized protein FTJAE_11106 [Fusarium tjaetaba]|uniref:Uncharacterized protein n=1 Tax=Fusarium tjaetaba TaxID=1567544 RepID=A0A8H5QUX6_9HYPO|nr:uncharacterized protein FTJAE_11106 [Fusarium tjaetaba]KAF5621729.1 hypothetical protein FTJAE_11106 [Fusarium tjaetaba]